MPLADIILCLVSFSVCSFQSVSTDDLDIAERQMDFRCRDNIVSETVLLPGEGADTDPSKIFAPTCFI